MLLWLRSSQISLDANTTYGRAECPPDIGNSTVPKPGSGPLKSRRGVAGKKGTMHRVRHRSMEGAGESKGLRVHMVN